MRADRLEEARTQAERALMLTRERGERGLEAWAFWLLGEIASRREPTEVETAEGHYRSGPGPWPTRAACVPLVARCHSGLGRLYRRGSQRSVAQEHLATATAMYRQMDMTSWFEQAEAELASLS